jgi:hypothetical protein
MSLIFLLGGRSLRFVVKSILRVKRGEWGFDVIKDLNIWLRRKVFWFCGNLKWNWEGFEIGEKENEKWKNLECWKIKYKAGE